MLNRNTHKLLIHVSIASILGFYLGCSKSSTTTNPSTTPDALPFCETVQTHSSPITITGSAQYFFRTNGNGAISGSANPIRYAEIKVTDPAGATIQCGTTDSSGNFSLDLPASGEVATIYVNSRAAGNYVNAYILKSPTTNQHYSISTTVNLDSSKSVGAISALATGSLEGGAFNILDKILDANNYLRTSTAGCTVFGGDCVPFTVAPNVTVYWAPGVNPSSYFGMFGAASFFDPDQDKLYILGGDSGDVDYSDTDHFDNSVIVHEYGHFIEDIYSVTDSPGGTHDGDSIIDPRLAWSEGFADFFQAAVNGSAVYRDTRGTTNGSAVTILNFDLESGTEDQASTLGEGNFREFSITRALWDMEDTANENGSIDTASNSFAKIWYLLTSATSGFKSTNFQFRSVGLLYQQHATLSSPNAWDVIIAAENQKNNQNDYSRSLAAGACAATTIQAVNMSAGRPEDGSYANSNLFASNDFYRYSHSGGNLSIALSYTTTGANPGNLDLLLYPEGYLYGTQPTGASTTSHAVGQAAGSELISGSIDAGNYMIVVRVNTTSGLGTAANYSLQINGVGVCPQ